MKPLLAIVGRPNVGKSTLYNRLVGGRPALVHDTSGMTRDRRYGEVDYGRWQFRLVDTGGLDFDADKDAIQAGIHRQAQAALQEAQVVLFVVDAKAGLAPGDRDMARLVRRLGKPIVVIANKVDSPKRDDWRHEFFALGLGEVYPVSAAHGRGVDDALDRVCELCPEAEQTVVVEPEEPAVRIALVGKPNAGKSSLLNRLVGRERSLVHHEPGTTTDPVDTRVSIAGRDYVVVDTAGIRRKARVDEDIEKLSVVLALDQIRRADVVVLMIDGALGPSEQDARLAGAIEKAGRGIVVALNKSDLLGAGEAEAVKKKLSDELHFLKHVPFHLMSAQRGDGVLDLLAQVDKVYGEYQRRVTTAQLNDFFSDVVASHPPPTYRGRSVTIQYLTQAQASPPTFLVFANRSDALSPSYKRYIENQLRKAYGFRGTPIKIVVKGKQGTRKGRPRGRKKARPPRKQRAR